jgi:hypothetical protein
MSETKQIKVDTELSTKSPRSKPQRSERPTKKIPRAPSKTIHKTFVSFGKNKNNRTVKVLLKGVSEYRGIDRDRTKLSKHSMEKVRAYLYKHHLAKVGTTASDELLREMYMNANLTGNIDNVQSDMVLNNYLNQV